MLKSFEKIKSLLTPQNARLRAPQSHHCRLEVLEERTLLSTMPLSASEYASLRAQYSEFDLPDNMGAMNVITLDLAEGDGLTHLKDAITTAGTTAKSDLIVVRTSDTANTLKFTSGSELLLEIDSNQYGSITIVGLGTENLTIDANRKCRAIHVSGETTAANLGGLTITNGYKSDTGAGGILISSHGSLKISNCVISANSATLSGGGIYVDYRCSLKATNCTISGNSSSEGGGGGIYNDGYLSITNCIISGNTTSSSGGGIINTNRSMSTITNCTISGNTDSSNGGGIWNNSTSTKVNNTIIVGNTSSNGNDIFNSSGSIEGYFNLSSYSDWSSGFNNYVYDSSKPLFANAARGDYRLEAESQAIDKGNNSLAVDPNGNTINYDFVHRPRFYNGTVDIGAYEYQFELFTPSLDIIPINEGTTVSITWDSVAKASAYQLDYKLSTDSEWTTQIVNGTSATFSGSAGEKYDVRVKALGSGNYFDSPYSQTFLVLLFDYESIREEYSEFNLPETGINIIVVDLTTGGDLADLKAAITQAGQTYKSDLIVVRTSDEVNTLNYTSSSDELIVNINSNQYGSVSIVGIGSDYFTLDANQKCRAMTVTGGTNVNLGGLAFLNGKTNGNGGGIYNNSSFLTVKNSLFSGNTVTNGQSGGGIATVNAGNLTVLDTTFSNNTASSFGGGIFHNSTNSLTVANCIFTRNTANGRGGGIANYLNCTFITVSNSTFSENTAYYDGGGIWNQTLSPTTITNCTISGNSASRTGGGIFGGSYVTITNTIISGNSAQSGGGINSQRGTITNCTISGNSASDFGGGIAGGTFTATNSIISMNLAPDDTQNIASPLSAASHNNLVDGYYQVEFVCPPVFDSEGKLANSDTMDLHLRSDSQAIDAGDSSAVSGLATDFDGNSRVFGDSVDIGAYEYQGNRNDSPYYSTVVNTLNDSMDWDDDEWSLREVICYAPEYVTITFAENLNGTITLTHGQLMVSQALAIDGDGRITIDADQKSRVMRVDGGTAENPVVLNGLTIQNGCMSTAGDGGGIYNTGTLIVTNCTITGNSTVYNSDGAGGGIANSSGTLTIENSTISGNSAFYSGGVSTSSGVLTITNCTISDNSAEYGGGLFNSYSTLTINNSTIAGNSAVINGGGLCNASEVTSINNSIIVGNTADTSGDQIFDGEGFISGSNNLSSFTGWSSGSNNLIYDPAKPLFVDSENGDYRLIAGSQAINKGNNDFVETETDLVGNPRIFNNTVDIGAYENIDPEALEFDRLYQDSLAGDYAYTFTLTGKTKVSFTHKDWSGLAVTLFHDDDPGEALAETIETKDLEAGTYTLWLSPLGNGSNVTYSMCITKTPVAVDDTLAGRNSISLIDVLANDSDPAGNHFSIVSVTQPAHGIAALLADGKILYIPEGNLLADSFTYTIENEFGGQSTATVTITVPENAQPVAQNDSARVELNGHVLIDVMANDSDPDGNALSILNVVQPENGTAALLADGTILYLPKTGFSGSDSFTYTVSDGLGGTAEATVSVEVIRTLRPLIVTPNEASPTSISEWETFNVEIHGAEGLTESQTISLAWDSSLFELNTMQAVGENGVSIVFGEAVTENGITTQNVVLNVENAAILDENALLANLEFLPAAEDSLKAGDTTDWSISVNRETLNLEVESFAYDLNDSGSVEIHDLVALARAFGKSGDSDENARIADFNGNGKVEINDLVLFARHFGQTRPSKPVSAAAPAAVPVCSTTPKLEEMPARERAMVNDVAMTAYLEETK